MASRAHEFNIDDAPRNNTSFVQSRPISERKRMAALVAFPSLHSIIPYGNLTIDATERDICYSLGRSVMPTSFCRREELRLELETTWDPSGHALVCLSVRSGLDLYIQANSMLLPPGSEVLMTAINIPDIEVVLMAHGLIPVPVDIEWDTLAPSRNSMQLALATCKNPRGFMVAELYGSRIDMSPIVDFCQRNDLLLIEDCAESFSGISYTGHADADISLFSFGGIKKATSFGGALLRVRDDVVLRRMRALHCQYKIQSHGDYAKRVSKYGVALMLLNKPTISYSVIAVASLLKFDHKAAFVSMIRGFHGDLISKIRFHPCAALMSTLIDRIRSFDENRLNEENRRINEFIKELPTEYYRIPGCNAKIRNYWLFPLIVADAPAAVREMNRRGVDAYMGSTQLDLVRMPPNRDIRIYPAEAAYLMNQIIYIPVHNRVSDEALQKIVQVLYVVGPIIGEVILPSRRAML